MGGRPLDPNPIGFNRYLYQRRILEADCVENETDEKKQAGQISGMFDAFADRLVCSGQFDIINGSVIKYAVNKKFDEFIDDLILWKVNLNHVDKGDGRTLLDYIQHQINRNKGNALESKLKSYFDQVRAEGAKFASELKKP